MKKKATLSLYFLLLTSTILAQVWSQKANFSSARYAATSFSLNGKGYLCLGSNSQTYFRDLQEYDPVSDTWQSRTQFPGVNRRTAVSFVIDSLAYVGLGWNNNGPSTYSDFYSYDSNQNTWTTIASYPGTGGRNSMAASVLGKGYVVGGTVNYITPYSNQLWEYDPTTNSWVQRASFPGGARATGIMFGIDSLIYCGLGHNASTDSKDLWAYNPMLNSWIRVADFPGVGRLNARVFVVNGKAIVGGGYQLGIGSELNDYYEYNPLSNTWTSINGFVAGRRAIHSTFTIGNKGYVCGGQDINNFFLNDLWEYSTLATSVPESNAFSKEKLSIYPNPSNGYFKVAIENGEGQVQVKVYTVRGQLVKIKEIKLRGGLGDIDLSGLVNGYYFYEILSNDNRFSGKLSISR